MVKPNRTSDGVCFKIRQPKPKRHPIVDEKRKFFRFFKTEKTAKLKLTCALVHF